MKASMRSAAAGRTRHRAGYRAAIILAAVSATAVFSYSSPASAFFDFGFQSFYASDPYFGPRFRRKLAPKKRAKITTPASATAAVAAPAGPLQMVVSIADQRVTVYADGKQFAQSPVSTGMRGHSTPTGVFSILEKHRHHHSNLYSNAPMPYMQRLTWSGIALHAGQLPGYPASHGCIRLPEEFARLLWGTTRLGARVIVSPSDVTPLDVAHPRLASLSQPAAPVTAELRGAAVEEGELVRTAAAVEPGGLGQAAALTDGPKASVAPVETGSKSPAEAKKDGAPDARPVSILVSRKTGKLQVRQGFKPLFEIAVTIKAPDQTWGTHVYTALRAEEPGTLRWTALSLHGALFPASAGRVGPRQGNAAASGVSPVQSAGAVLDAFEIPEEARDRLAGLITPGATLIVSDHAPSGETGPGTDFIVLAR